MVKQAARLDGKEMSGGGVVEVTTEEAVTIQKAALIMLMQATPEQRLAHVSLPESYTTEHMRAVYQNLPEFDEESLKARDIIVRASRLLTAKMVRQRDARALVDAWRDEWHLEPEPEMDNGTSQVYESLVNHVASALASASASPAALRDEAKHLSGSAGSERLSTQGDKPMKNYDDFRAGMLRAAEIARDEFKRAPEAAKGHDSVYMGGYEDACDHLSVVIAQAAVIDSVRIAGPQPDWQYHISLLFPDGIEDKTLLKIFQVVEHELRAATTPPSTPAKATAERAAAEMGAPLDKTQTGSSVFLQIPTCGRCPFVDHSGSFTPGGAKTICNHRDAVETFAANVAGEDRYHWKYRQVNHDAAPPEQCPLRVLTVR